MVTGDGRYLTVNGLNLHYMQWGQPGGTALLMLHGYGNCAATWSALAESLAGEYYVVAPDFRGHGDSQWDEAGRYGIRYYLEDTEALLDALKIDEVVIIGHSMGAQVALAYAAANPGKVARLVDIDIGPEFNPASEARLKQTTQLRREAYDRLEEVTDYLQVVDPYAGRELLRQEAADLTRQGEDGRYVWKHHYAAAGHRKKTGLLKSGERWDMLEKVDCPVLIIRGEHSDVLAPEVARRMVKVMARAELEEVAGAGHYVHRDRPLEIRRIVGRFLSRGSPV